jgi:hypothetical protein
MGMTATRSRQHKRRSAGWEGTTALIAQFKALLDAQIGAPLSKEGNWLVRPDGYVACSAHEPAAISKYLSSLVHSLAISR